MAPALLRWEECLNVVGEQDEPDFVVVANRTPGQHSAQFCSDFSLQAQHAAKLPRGAQVHEQHDRQFAFLHIALDIWLSPTRRDVPIHGPHLIPGHVFADLITFHAAPLKSNMINANQYIVHKTTGADMNASDLLQDVTW